MCILNILFFIYGKTRWGNENIRERRPRVEKMMENRLRWFGHIERRPKDFVVRRVDQMEESQTSRGRGRPRKIIIETIRKDLEINELDQNMVYDRTLVG